MTGRHRAPEPVADGEVWAAVRQLVTREVRALVADGWSNPDTLALVVDTATHRLVAALAAGMTELPDVP